jgi:hypothetical protein
MSRRRGIKTKIQVNIRNRCRSRHGRPYRLDARRIADEKQCREILHMANRWV